MAHALARTDVPRAKALLEELRHVQPARDEATQLLDKLNASKR
jgi:hypothetical protein